MILDTIKQFHAQFGNMNEDDIALLGITPKIEDPETLKTQFLAGKWSALHFSVSGDLDVTDALKIIPNISGSGWPVYWLFPEGQFQSSNITSYLPYLHSEQLFSLPDIGKKYKSTWDRKIAIMNQVQKIFGGKDSDFDEMKEIVFDESKWAKAGKKYADINMPDGEVVAAKYRAYWLKRDSSAGCHYLFDLLDKVIADVQYLPGSVPSDLGIYEPRIKMIIAMRALKLFEGGDRMLPGLLMPHGFDIEDRHPTYKPNVGNQRHLFDLAVRVGSDYGERDEIRLVVIPEMKAFKIIAGQLKGDSGMAFLEAAAIRDEKFNEPLLAWNNLVSAGFWTGINMGDTEKCAKAQAVIINAAIYLCEKNKWTEAAEVLKYNLNLLETI